MNEQEIKKQIETLQREYKDIRKAISLALNLNNNAILAVTIARPGVAAESILKFIIRRERINVKTNDPKIPIERADEIRKIEVQKVMLDEMIKLVEQRIPLRIVTHLRTIQAWRNIGSHDQGENYISETVNSSTLQVVNIALSELVNWFVGEYLNHDISGFNYNEVLPEDKTEISSNEWQEEYWFAMRKGFLKALDEAKLNKIQHIHNISNEAIDFIKSNFERKEELFIQILNEAFDDGIIDIDELEAIEHSRTMFCISSKETKEILEKFNWKSKFKDNPEKLNVDWMRDELVSYRQLLESNVDNELLNKTKIDDLDSSPLSNIDIKKSDKDFGIQIQETDKHSLTNNITTSDSIELDVFEAKRGGNSLAKEQPRNIDEQSIPLFELETTTQSTIQPVSGITNEESIEKTGLTRNYELSSGDLVCCIQPFHTIIGGKNVLINSGVVFSVESVERSKNSITLKEFSVQGKANNTWLPSSSFSCIVQLPLLEECDLGAQDRIVCCNSESDSSNLHSELIKGYIYTISGVKKHKKLVSLEEFPQSNVSEKKKWFNFEYFRAFDIMTKPEETSNPLQESFMTVQDAEVEIMMATINGMLKSFRGDKKKWALQYNGHELFSIASGVLSGRIKNSGLKDAIAKFLSKRNK